MKLCFLFPPLVAFFLDYGIKTLVMPLKNGTQKERGLGPDFRRDGGKGRDDGDGKGQDDDIMAFRWCFLS